MSYPNSKGVCRNHPDRPRIYTTALCRECFNKKMRDRYVKKGRAIKAKYSEKLKSNWEEINLKNLLDDAKRMTVSQLAKRYRRNNFSIREYLTKHKTQAKDFMSAELAKGQCSVIVKNPPVMLDACANVYPKHHEYRAAV